MKKLFITLIICWLATNLNAQIVPIKTTNKNYYKEKTNETSTHIGNSLIDSKSMFNFLLPKKESEFEINSKSFHSDLMQSYKEKEKKFELEFLTKRKALYDKFDSTSKSIADIKLFKHNKELLESEYSTNLGNIKELKELSLHSEFQFKMTKGLKFFPSVKSNSRGYISKLYYENSTKEVNNYLGNSSLSFDSKGKSVAIQSELYADYFGAFRISTGVLVNSSNVSSHVDSTGKIHFIDSSDIKVANIQKFIGGGGNLYGTISFPLTNSSFYGNSIVIRTMATPRFAFSAPQLGNTQNRGSFNCDYGIDGQAYWKGMDNTLGIFITGRVSIIKGDEEFNKSIGNYTDDKVNSSFKLIQGSIGAIITNNIRLSYHFYYGDDFVRKAFTNQVSLSFVR